MKRISMLIWVAVLIFSLAPGGALQASEVTFTAPELLGCPTDSSITVNALAEEDLEVYFEYGTKSGDYDYHYPRHISQR